MQQEWQRWKSERDNLGQDEPFEDLNQTSVLLDTPVRLSVSTFPEDTPSSSNTRASSANRNPPTPEARSASAGSQSRSIGSILRWGGHGRTRSNIRNIVFESAISPDGHFLAVWHRPRLAVCDVSQNRWHDPNIEDVHLVKMTSETLFVVSKVVSVSVIGNTDKMRLAANQLSDLQILCNASAVVRADWRSCHL